jgi:hypothetical protein
MPPCQSDAALPKRCRRAILEEETVFRSTLVAGADPSSTPAATADRPRPAAYAWVPLALLGAGVLLGVALWAKWGFAIAFEAIRAYCF